MPLQLPPPHTAARRRCNPWEMALPPLPVELLLLAGTTAALGAVFLLALWWKRAALHIQVEKRLRVRVERITDTAELAKKRGELDTQRGCGRCGQGGAAAQRGQGRPARALASAHCRRVAREYRADPALPPPTPARPACAACCAWWM